METPNNFWATKSNNFLQNQKHAEKCVQFVENRIRTMSIPDIIADHLEKRGFSESYLAKQVGMQRSGLNKRLAKNSLDSELLKKITATLGHAFWIDVAKFFTEGVALPEQKTDNELIAALAKQNLELQQQASTFKSSGGTIGTELTAEQFMKTASEPKQPAGTIRAESEINYKKRKVRESNYPEEMKDKATKILNDARSTVRERNKENKQKK